MASIEKRGNRFRIVFRLGNEKHFASLKTAERREAESCLSRLEENLRMVERGRLVIPDNADPGIFLLTDGKLVQKVKYDTVMTFSGLAEKYRSTFTVDAKEKNTLTTERIHMKHFEKFFGAKTLLTQISNATVQGYIASRTDSKYREKPIRPQTIKKEIATLKFVWNWAQRNGYVTATFPGTILVYPKTKLKEPFRTYDQIKSIIDRGGMTKMQERELWDGLFLNPNEISEILDFIKNQSWYPWLYPFVVTAAYTGARRSELLRARVDDFDFINKVVVLREKKRCKDRETFRTVEMLPILEKEIQSYFKHDHPGGLFAFAEKANEPVNDSNNQKAMKRVLQKSKWEKLRGYHAFRHSFVSVLASSGVDQRLIDEMTGHQTEEMRRRYRHLTPQVKRAALFGAFSKTQRVGSVRTATTTKSTFD
ncbi:MAG: site-specific integrase [Gemmataceae bacterium]